MSKRRQRAAGVTVKSPNGKEAFIEGYAGMPEFEQAWMLGLAISAIENIEKGLEMFDIWSAGEYLAVPRLPVPTKEAALLLWADSRCALVEVCLERAYPAKDEVSMRALVAARRTPQEAVAALLAMERGDGQDVRH